MKFDVVFVGGGVSGLAAGFELQRRRPELNQLVLEKDGQVGGKTRSSSEEGFTFDWGANGFRPTPETLQLVERLGIEEKLASASERARFRYLYKDGGLRRVPRGPGEFLTSQLLSPGGKLRAALEPILSGRQDREESVYGFVARHFGFEVAGVLAEAMVLGVTAGDARRLSLDALFPALRRLEAESGSLLRGMVSSRGRPESRTEQTSRLKQASHNREASRTPPASGRRAASAPPLYSFSPEGMGALTSALAERVPVRTEAEVTRLIPLPEGGFELTLTSGERLESERVVLAVPAFSAAHLLRSFLPAAADPLERIEYADVDVFALGFHRVDVAHPLDGFGFLVPRGEGVRSLGVLWTSSLFEQRAPNEAVLLRVIAGGAVDPGFHRLGHDDALAAVRRDLRLTLGVVREPQFSRRISIPRAIPQYLLGHGQLVARAMTALSATPGVVLAGNAYFGVAVNDCVRDAVRVVDELLMPNAG